MDTLEFFNTVLPHTGQRCTGTLTGTIFRNFFGADNLWAVDAATRISATGKNAYIALGGFGPAGSRKQDNVVALRCSWLDIDTREGKPKETYANRKEALIELTAFCEEVGMPPPLVVSSGYGLHIYWTYTHDVTRQKWKQIATLLKAACEKYGLCVDPSRTTDEASVLRPVGTQNYKNSKSKSVNAIKRGEDTDPDELLVILADYLGEDVDMFSQAGPSHTLDLNSDLTGGITYEASSAEKVAEHCGVMALMRDTRGDIDQPTWYAGLGITSFTSEGDDLSHEWSNGYAGYSKQETDSKIAQAKQFKPTTCQKMAQLQPEICKACQYFGKINSPIRLGMASTEPQPIEISPVVAAQIGKLRVDYPEGYGWGDIEGYKNPCLWHTIMMPTENGDEVKKRVFLCDVKLYPVARIADKKDHHIMRLRMETVTGYVKEFDVENSMITRGDKSIMAELGKHEIAVAAANRPKMEAYLSSWINKLRDEYKNTPTVIQYGWHNEGFVVGETYVTKTGNQRAMVSGSAAVLAPFLTCKGSLENWVAAVDQAYNNKQSVPLQYCMMTSFAAPLFPMFGDKGGVTVYAHSAGSGYGKSTAQMVGLSAWGYYKDLILQESNFTVNALYSHMGTMCNLPVVIDEMTNADNKFASALVFAASAGKGKARLTADGTPKPSLDWSTIVAASGNNLLSEKLSLHRANAESELSRIFEFTLTTRGTMPTHIADELFSTIYDNHGHAGMAYAKYIVDNKDVVKAMLFKMREVFNARCRMQQQERYWAALHAAILTALVICNKIGLVNFNLEDMMAWIEKEVNANRRNIKQSVSQPLEQFADFLSDIWRGVLVTEGEGNLSQNLHATVVGNGPNGVITGRSIIQDRTSAEKLYISVGSAKEWCNQHGVSFKEMHEALVDAKWAMPTIKRISLGKGTKQYSGLGGPVKVWEINPSAVRTEMGDASLSAKIIGTIQGGLDDSAAEA